MQLQPGTIIDSKYRVAHAIGSGGMGVVVAADHLHLPQRVAVKVLKQASRPESLERFYREGRTLAQLTGDHVTRVFDVGALPGGEPYLVMELLEGEDLAAMVRRRGPLPVEEAVDYLLQACVGLAEAHLVGIIHRDIKPANLFVARTNDQRQLVKVLDFGISKANEAAKGPGTALTESGAMLGSPRFMSPEQLRSTRDVDERADIWSLGVTLYELLVGAGAFSAPSVAELVIEILTASPAPLGEVAPHVPPGLQAVVARCISSEPDGRYGSVAELVVALAEFGGVRGSYWKDRVAALYQQRGRPMPAPAPVATPTVAMTAPVSAHDDPGVRAAVQSVGAVSAQTSPSVDIPRVPAETRARTTFSGGKLAAAAFVVVASMGVGGAFWLSSGDSREKAAPAESDDDGGEAETKKKKAQPKKAAPEPHAEALAMVKKLPAGPFWAVAPGLAAAVKRAHGRDLRCYDVVLYEKRARFVVEGEDGLVYYELSRQEVKGPKTFKGSTLRSDSVLLDEATIPFEKADVAAKKASGGEKVFSVGLQRDGKGFGWQVAFTNGTIKRFDLKGNPR